MHLTSSQSTLSSGRHSVRLVQHNQFEAALIIEDIPRACETLDLLSHDVNSSVIGSVQLRGVNTCLAGKSHIDEANFKLTSSTLFLKLVP
jgi:hypothetical protein